MQIHRFSPSVLVIRGAASSSAGIPAGTFGLGNRSPSADRTAGSKRFRGSSQLASDSAHTEYEPDRAHHDRADAEDDQSEIPQRPLVVPECEIEAVQPVEEPALHAVQAMDLGHDPCELRINVYPGLERIVELDAQNRQRRLPAARVIVRIVVLEQLVLDDVKLGRK